MTIAPVDDPRPRARNRRGTGTVEEQMVGAINEGLSGLVATMLKGFDTVLQSTNAAMKEHAEAKRDLQQTLDMVIRAKADAVALSGGMGGMAPPGARGPVAVAVQELDEAREIRRRAAQPTDENYKRQARDPATGRFVKRQAAAEEVQGQREDRFDEADKRVDEAAKRRDEEQRQRQEQLDRHDAERQQRVSPASTGRRPRLDYEVDFTGGFRGLEQQTRQGIRESVYRAAAARAEPYVHAEGLSSDLATRQVQRIREDVQMDPTTGQYHDAEGNVVPANEAAQAIGSQSSFARKAMTAQLGVRALDAWRGGGMGIGRSLASALPSGVLKAAGGVGVAVSAANQVWQGVQNQYEQNRQYQEVYGGGNLNQIDDRFDRWINKNIRGRFSFLGGGNYDALFGQAMEQGLRGDDRGEYINEGAQIMGQGVGAEQTGRIMGIAVETGQALSGLSDAIRSVNDAAKDAGINARRARDIFVQNYQASSDIMFGGAGSQRMATAVTQAQVGMARQYQDVNLMGSYSGDAMRGRLLAGRAGMPYTEWIGATLDNPTLGMVASEEQIQEQLGMLRSEKPGEERRIPDVVREYMASIGGAAQFNAQVDQPALARAIMDAGFSPEQVAMFLQGNGVQVNDVRDAPGIAAMYFTNMTAGQIAQRTDEEMMAEVAPGEEFANSFEAGEYYGAGTNQPDDLKRSYLLGISGQGQDEDDNRAVEEAAAGASRNLITERFLEQQEDLELDTDTRLLINARDEQTGELTRRIVNLDWALEHTPDQIATATIMGGANEDYTNMTVEEALGLPSGTAAQYTNPSVPTLDQEARENEEIQSMQEWNAQLETEADAAAASGETQTALMLDLTPLARQLLQPVSSSAPYFVGSSGTGGNIVDYATMQE